MILSLPWLSQLFFIFIRLGTVLLFTPIQAIRQLPIHVRLIFIFTLGILLSNYLSLNLEQDDLLLGALAEFANGLVLSLAIYMTFAIFQIAGQLIDSETGFNSMAIFNPGEHSHEPLTSHFLSLLAVLFFFGLVGHQWLFKGLLHSFIIIPPGTLSLFKGFTPVLKQFTWMFGMSFMIASPIMVILIAIDVCGALVTRNMPQINAYFLTLPIKILSGLLLLSLLLNYFNPLSRKIFAYCFQTWQELMS